MAGPIISAAADFSLNVPSAASTPALGLAIAGRIAITEQLKRIGQVAAEGPVPRWQRDHDVAAVQPRMMAALKDELGTSRSGDALHRVVGRYAFAAIALPWLPANGHERADALRFVRLGNEWRRRYQGATGAVVAAVLRDAADEARRASTPASLSLKRLAVAAVVDRIASTINGSTDPERQRAVLHAVACDRAPTWQAYVPLGELHGLPAALRQLMPLFDAPPAIRTGVE
jgi:hypothetical protein